MRGKWYVVEQSQLRPRITPAHAGKDAACFVLKLLGSPPHTRGKEAKNMIAHGLTNVNKEEKMNNVTLIGNLTRDPELRAYNGESCCKFSVADERGRKRADGTQEADVHSRDCMGQAG